MTADITVCLQDLNKRQGLALLTKVGESVKHVAGGYKLRARPAEFCAMGEYLDTFSQKLGTIDRIAQRILKEQSGNTWMEILYSGLTLRGSSSVVIPSEMWCKTWYKKRLY